MKPTLFSCTFLLAAVASAANRQPRAVAAANATSETDRLLFQTSLPDFVAQREKRQPEYLDWSSDGCTDSPDNPFNFPFLPACWRHDFGYNNYRPQRRFTRGNKKMIDGNFRLDLYVQCRSVKASSACRALANIYYFAVSVFGGPDASARGKKRAATPTRALLDEYDRLVGLYEAEVERAQESGDLPRQEEADLKSSLKSFRVRIAYA
ncbi:hypothetical protein E4U41_005312 [Claviceps citrina]|nr:hypothetical protein E4U41_005312 [Claviceps citrina]